MAIVGSVSDVRSSDIDKTTGFYTGLLGFETRMDADDVVAFVSPTHVLHPPSDFPEHGIRCFMLFEPNGVAVNVAAVLSDAQEGRP